jgi:uncharacterized membrane protein YdbT with pleckstrin-like domain
MHRFCQYPDCKGFVLHPGNEVTCVIRKHWIAGVITLAKWIFWGPFCIWLYFFFFFLLKGDITSDNFFLGLSCSILYLLGVTFYYFLEWLDDMFDIIFLTNDRVVDVTQVDFWHRNIIETRLEYVQDATGDVKGVFRTLFDWGKIRVRTANDVADFSIDLISHPHKKAREIFRLVNVGKEKEKERKNSSTSNPPQENKQETIEVAAQEPQNAEKTETQREDKTEENPKIPEKISAHQWFSQTIKSPLRDKINILMTNSKK